MFDFLFKSKVSEEERISGSFLVIRCELVADSKLETDRKYVISELNYPIEYVGKSNKEDLHFLKIKGTKNFTSLSGNYLYQLLLGRLIEDSRGAPVATIFKFVNIVSVME